METVPPIPKMPCERSAVTEYSKDVDQGIKLTTIHRMAAVSATVRGLKHAN